MSDQAPPHEQPANPTRLIKARAVLFDCDGVLVSSDASVISAWSRWASRYGLQPSDVLTVVHGRRAADTVAALIDTDRRHDALTVINEFEIEDASTVPAIPGAPALVSSMPMGAWAVVTSGVLALATARMRAAGLPLPTALVTADVVSNGKPDPEGYLMAADMLGIPVGECIVIEDAVDGVRAARAAGAGAVVGVGSRLDPSQVDAHVDTLTPLRWSAEGLSITETTQP